MTAANEIRIKSVYAGVVIGVVVAFFAAALPTAMDWYSNPGGIFRTGSASNWPIVFQTWFSWFWPVAVVSIPTAIIAHAYLRNRNVENRM